MSHKLSNVTVKRDSARWEVEIKAELPAEELQRFYDNALRHYQKNIILDGFRPGKAPVAQVVEKVGEQSILHHAAEEAVQNELPLLLATEKLMIVEAPKVTIAPPQKGEPLSFTARAPLAPEIQLPDYAKIAEKHRATTIESTVTEHEVKDTLTHLRRERARIEKIETGTDPKEAMEQARAMEEKDLPELDDAFAQTLGYESAVAFDAAVRANIKNEKDIREMEKRRVALLDELTANAKISYPATLKEYELNEMESQLSHDLARMGMTIEGYLENNKTTREGLRASWHDAADKRAKVRLILAEIGHKENIVPDPHMLDHEVEHAKKRYPDTPADLLRSHIAHAMRNEKVIRFLDGTPEPAPHDHSADR